MLRRLALLAVLAVAAACTPASTPSATTPVVATPGASLESTMPSDSAMPSTELPSESPVTSP